MISPQVTDFWMYRHRYTLGFGISLFVICLLAIVMFYIPGGISSSEMNSAVQSHTLTVANVLHPSSFSQIANLPFRLLQKMIIHFFGISTLSIKLPSIILGLIATMALYGVLRLWYRRNVAIISGLIAGTSTSFLLSAQRADGGVMYILWPALILFFATYLAQPFRFKPVIAFFLLISVALGLYTPTVVDLLFALIATGLLHPHARRTLRTHLVKAIPGIILFVALLEPLVVAIVRQPKSIVALFGLGHILPPTQWLSNIAPYWHINSVTSGVIATPVFAAPIVLLALVGIYRLFSVKYTARSYLLTIWSVLLLIITITTPMVAPRLFVLVMLLVGVGVDFIIRQWYKLFPLNPYARVAGLLPLGVLVGGIVFANIEAYVYGYHYSAAAYQAYTPDLKLLQSTVNMQSKSAIINILVSEPHRAFYQVYADTQHTYHIIVINAPQDAAPGTVLIADGTSSHLVENLPTRIITSGTSKDSARFFVYEN